MVRIRIIRVRVGDRMRVGVSVKYGRQLCATVILGGDRCAGRGCNCPTFNIS